MALGRGLVLGGAGLLAAAATAQAATEPVAATYSQYQYVVSSSSSPAGLTGCNAVGTTLGGIFHFPGAAKAGAYTTGAVESSGEMRIQICVYPTTPAAGATTYAGTVHCTNTYQTGAPSTYTETFSWAITYVSSTTFLAKKTITYPVTGGMCTEVRNTGFQRTGN